MDLIDITIFWRYPMPKRYSKLNFRTLLLVLIAIVMVADLFLAKR